MSDLVRATAPPVRSPLLDRAGAVAADGPDTGVAAHYGEPAREQRRLDAGEGVVDLSHHGVVRVGGPDRLAWLHSLTSQHLSALPPGSRTEALLLSPHGHVEHHLRVQDDGSATWLLVEPGTAGALVDFLDRMRFMLRVEVADVTDELAVLWSPLTGEGLVARTELASAVTAEGRPAGVWAYEALRIAAGHPRLGLETDHKTLPHEVGWIPSAVHLDKGCYRGQETVARVHTLGRPPRRLVLLHLDGSVDRLPAHGDAVTGPDGRAVGWVGSAARHHELGPIALALVKRALAVDVELLAGGVAAAQEVVVDPDVGLHVRPRLR
jgi:tRNA-modifying protein YgfZ